MRALRTAGSVIGGREAVDPPVRVVVVDDNEIVRDGLCALVSGEPDLEVIGSAATAEDGLAQIERLSPDVALIDYSLPAMSGADLCEILAERSPQVRTVILTYFGDESVIRNSLEAGASAYLYKDVDSSELKKAIRAVAEGHCVIDPNATPFVLRWARNSSVGAKRKALSTRETEVLRLAAGGASNREIAEAMQLSTNTVKTYVAQAAQKLRCTGRLQAVATALELGLL